MLRICLGALPAERFFILTGSGRNGKGLILKWMCFLLGEELSQELMPLAMLTQTMTGAGPNPEMRKAHRRRLLNWTEPPEEDEEGSNTYRTRKAEVKLLLSEIKRITGESTMTARDCNSNDSRCDLWGTTILQCNQLPRITGKVDDSVVERIVVIDFPLTFTSDEAKLQSNPAKYKPIDTALKEKDFLKEHYCALVQLLFVECPDGNLFISPECKSAANAYLGKQDTFQSFLDEHCIRKEVAPARLWLGVKEMLTAYNEEMGTKLKEKDLKQKLKSHFATAVDYKEKGQAILSDVPLRRNTANGLLNWQMNESDQGEDGGGSKRPRLS